MIYNKESKVYVNVIATFTRDGLLIPRSIEWDDASVFEVQRVKEVRRVNVSGVYGSVARYTCVIWGDEHFLYFEDNNNRWFVERNIF